MSNSKSYTFLQPFLEEIASEECKSLKKLKEYVFHGLEAIKQIPMVEMCVFNDEKTFKGKQQKSKKQFPNRTVLMDEHIMEFNVIFPFFVIGLFEKSNEKFLEKLALEISTDISLNMTTTSIIDTLKNTYMKKSITEAIVKTNIPQIQESSQSKVSCILA